jgi:hypothetical protein
MDFNDCGPPLNGQQRQPYNAATGATPMTKIKARYLADALLGEPQKLTWA